MLPRTLATAAQQRARPKSNRITSRRSLPSEKKVRDVRGGTTICANSSVGEVERNGRADNAVRQVQVEVGTYGHRLRQIRTRIWTCNGHLQRCLSIGLAAYLRSTAAGETARFRGNDAAEKLVSSQLRLMTKRPCTCRARQHTYIQARVRHTCREHLARHKRKDRRSTRGHQWRCRQMQDSQETPCTREMEREAYPRDGVNDMAAIARTQT